MTDEPEFSRHHQETRSRRRAGTANGKPCAIPLIPSAHLLDSVVHIPGTSIRVGLDAFLGLIPGLGDWIANLIGTTILFLAVKLPSAQNRDRPDGFQPGD